MSILDRIFPSRTARGGGGSGGARPEVALPPVVDAIADAVTTLEDHDVDAALLRARLADRCRDAGVDPVAPAEVDGAVMDLDAEGWRRLLALAETWWRPGVGDVLDELLRASDPSTVQGRMVGIARERALLTMTVLCTSRLRVEELARAWLRVLDVRIAGETAAESAAALERLDYDELLAAADQARAAAEGRMQQLRKAQDDEDRARAPRGKW
jgi:hypothetical protein